MDSRQLGLRPEIREADGLKRNPMRKSLFIIGGRPRAFKKCAFQAEFLVQGKLCPQRLHIVPYGVKRAIWRTDNGSKD